jgi:6-pyruvoyltetrahydropterin/6-carboxytetrahydropterin synthase
MTADTYTLKIITDFSAAHTLRGYPGACSRMHGHNWKLEVEVAARSLDNTGMVVDFKVIKEAARVLAEQLDHRYVNEIAPFDRINPTAENLAAYLYQGLAEMLNDARVRVRAVTLWETDRACVRYTEDEAP